MKTADLSKMSEFIIDWLRYKSEQILANATNPSNKKKDRILAIDKLNLIDEFIIDLDNFLKENKK